MNIPALDQSSLPLPNTTAVNASPIPGGPPNLISGVNGSSSAAVDQSSFQFDSQPTSDPQSLSHNPQEGMMQLMQQMLLILQQLMQLLLQMMGADSNTQQGTPESTAQGVGGTGGGAGGTGGPGKDIGWDGGGEFRVGDSWGGWDGVSSGKIGSSHDVQDRRALLDTLMGQGLSESEAESVTLSLHSAQRQAGLDADKGSHSPDQAIQIKQKNHANIEQAFNSVGPGGTATQYISAINNVYGA